MDKNYNPPISIIIPTKNEEDIIEKIIKRWLNINYPNKKEIIFVDASSDRTPEIIKHYTKKYKHVKYVKGFTGSKLGDIFKGIKRAKNPIIVLSDADVLVEKGHVKKAVNYLVNENVGVVFGKGIPINYKKSLFKTLEAIRFLYNWTNLKFFTKIDSVPYVSMLPCVLRKGDVKKIPVRKNLIADDLYLGVKLRQNGLKCIFIPDIKSKIGVIGNLKDLFVNGIRSIQGTTQIAFANYYGILFNKKYGKFGMISIPFWYYYRTILGFIWGVFLFSIILDLLIFKISFILTMILYGYIILLFTSILMLISIIVVSKYKDWRFALLIFLYPIYFLIRELVYSLGIYLLLFKKTSKWKKTTSDRV